MTEPYVNPTRSGGPHVGCFTEWLAFLVVVWLVIHLPQVLAFLDRVLAWQP
jgi:hypothetical protein